MGPSGSGKSTLLNLIGTLDIPTRGKIVIDGIDVTKLSEGEKDRLRNRKIGFIFQFFNLINELTVLENVMLPRLILGDYKAARIEALEMLRAVGLADKAHYSAARLSGGEMQRVSIARALINRPALVLADEPTGNLDSKTGKEIMDLLINLNKEHGKTVIIVTHDLNIAKGLKRLIHLKDGKIIGG